MARLLKQQEPQWKGSDESMISQCLQGAMRYRGMFESVVAAATAPKANNKVDQRALPGNVAVAAASLESVRSREIIPVTPLFVSASHKGVDRVTKNLNYDGATPYFVRSVNGLRNFEITSPADDYGETDFTFRARFWPQRLGRGEVFSDSEYLLVNAIDSYLRNVINVGGKSAFRRAGAIYLFTERLPCDHCISVLSKFQEKYRRFRVVIGFMHGHGEQTERRLIESLNDKSSVYRFPLPPPVFPNLGQSREVAFQLRAQQISGPGLKVVDVSNVN